jgi:hypothetical protein
MEEELKKVAKPISNKSQQEVRPFTFHHFPTQNITRETEISLPFGKR